MEKTKNMDFTAVPVVTELEPTRALDAFKNAMFRPMFNFFTRAEGGHGDTINRYSFDFDPFFIPHQKVRR